MGLTVLTLSRQPTAQLFNRNLRLQFFFQLGIDYFNALQTALQHRQHFLFQQGYFLFSVGMFNPAAPQRLIDMTAQDVLDATQA